MVFGRRSKALADEIRIQADHEQYAKKYGQKYLQANFEEGEIIYSPLWDKYYTLLDLEDDWLAVEDDEHPDGIIMFQPWEVKKHETDKDARG